MRKLSKGEWVAVAIAIVFVSYTLFGSNIMSFFQQNTMKEDSIESVVTTSDISGVVTKDIVVGQGVEVKQGDRVSAHYLLALSDGTVIQNSKDFGVPFQFTLGAGEVIQGWEKGFAGMKVGGIRMITIPPELAYGDAQAGPIPPNSTLVFTVELIETTPNVAQNPILQ